MELRQEKGGGGAGEGEKYTESVIQGEEDFKK